MWIYLLTLSMQQLTLSFVALLVLTVLSACTGQASSSTTTSSVQSEQVVQSTTTASDTDTLSTSTSGINTITNSTTYSTDHGKHRVTANFSITTSSDGTISSATATMTSGDRESRQYINRFNSAAKTQIIGKKISELSLSAVGGASDTTDAFVTVVDSL